MTLSTPYSITFILVNCNNVHMNTYLPQFSMGSHDHKKGGIVYNNTCLDWLFIKKIFIHFCMWLCMLFLIPIQWVFNVPIPMHMLSQSISRILNLPILRSKGVSQWTTHVPEFDHTWHSFHMHMALLLVGPNHRGGHTNTYTNTWYIPRTRS